MEQHSFDEFYQLEFDRIPAFFRSSEKKKKIVKNIIIVLVLAELIMLFIMPSTQKIVDGIIPHAVYSMSLFKVMAVVFFLILAVLLWIGIAILFEERANKLATVAHRDYMFMYRDKIKQEQDLMRIKSDM